MSTKSDGFQIALLLGGAVLVYFVLKKQIGNITKPVADAIADAYVAMTNWIAGSGKVAPLGSVFLNDTQQFVPVAQLVIRMVSGTDEAQFSCQNRLYRIKGPSDANGNWAAVRM